MRILVADQFAPGGREELQKLGLQLDYEPDTSAEALGDRIAAVDPDIVIVRSTKVQETALSRAGRLKLIIRAGAGTDTIDVEAASRAGVFVSNCPAKNAAAVAELAIGHMINCDRRISDQCADLREGRWNKKEYSKARGLKDRTLGIVGTGTIAREVIHRARAFGMSIVAWSRSLTPERAEELGVGFAETPIEVARRSHVVSVHVASTAETHHLIGRAFVEALPEGAHLINTSRGDVVDEAALEWGIANRGLRAGLDVYAGEPKSGVAEFDSAITGLAYGTHHIGASTEQAQDAISDEAVRVVREFVDRGVAENCVNLAEGSSGVCQLVVRHRNQPGVLAQVLRVLSEEGVNVEEMENVLYRGKVTACARIRLSKRPSDSTLREIESNSQQILGVELSSAASP